MQLLQQALNGLFVGGVYALFAVGLTLSLGVLRVLNLAHGVTLTIAAIAGVKLTSDYVALPFPLLVLFGALVGGVIGVALELVAFRPLRVGPSETNAEMPSLVSSLAVLLILQTLAQLWTRADVLRFPTEVFQSSRVEVGPFATRSILIIMFAVAVFLTAACWWILNRTMVGRAVRAVAMDGEAAEMMGINSNRLKLATLSVSSALAGIAGILLGVALSAVEFTMGEPHLLRGFTVVILGGIGSVPGALLGGLLLGVGEGLTVHLFGSGWREAVGFVLLMVFLIVRPQGIFGKPELDRA